MSKKIAENPAHGLVLDVKTGSGAFLRDFDASVALAEAVGSDWTAAGESGSVRLYRAVHD